MTDVIVTQVVDDSQVQKAHKEGLLKAAQVTRAFRRAGQLGLLAVQVAGVVVDEILRLQVEALLLSVESLTSIAAIGLNPTAVLRLGQVAVILFQINALNQAREDSARRLGALEQGLDLLLF